MLARYTANARYNNTIATIIALIGFMYSIEIKSNRHGIQAIAQLNFAFGFEFLLRFN